MSTIDRFIEQHTHGQEHMEAVENAPATTKPFRRWDYSDTYFDKGVDVLRGDDLNFWDQPFIGVADLEELDYHYPAD